MKLTGKCKEEFEKWYLKLTYHFPKLNTCIKTHTVGFYNLPPSMQYGVLVDYFDSVGIYIAITRKAFVVYIKGNKKGEHGGVNTRQEAREQTILKANEIRNEELNK